MGIYLPNMEMPTSPVLFCIHPDGQVFADLEGGWREYNAIPVPPHGDLIDRDAYEKLLRGLGSRDYRREKGTICDAIKFLHPHYAPVIIPASKEGE